MATKNKVWDCGDWCYCEYELCEIVKIVNGRVEDITDGYARKCCQDWREEIFEVSMDVKMISEEYRKTSDEIHKIGCGLNMPDIHRWLVSHWKETCETVLSFKHKKATPKQMEAESDYLSSRYRDLHSFKDDLDKATSPRMTTHGVCIFNRRT